MTLLATNRTPVTLGASFSMYVPAGSKANLDIGSRVGDALTVAGPNGPEVIRQMRRNGFEKPVIFDGVGYDARRRVPEAGEWVAAQVEAEADRPLLPGVYLDWDADSEAGLEEIVTEQGRLGEALGAGALIAVDARWLKKRYETLTDGLMALGCPVAVVLAHRGDPLAQGAAVAGLRWMARRVQHLSVLRSDHGAIGAVAFGADHAGVGLSTSTRHFTTGAMNARSQPTKTPRIFVRPLLDWFLASVVAGWGSAGVDLTCPLVCCDGQPLSRFLDSDAAPAAVWHNIIALADFADYIIDADPDDRSAVFLEACREATSLYGIAGMHGPEEPKAQLTGWVLS